MPRLTKQTPNKSERIAADMFHDLKERCMDHLYDSLYDVIKTTIRYDTCCIDEVDYPFDRFDYGDFDFDVSLKLIHKGEEVGA